MIGKKDINKFAEYNYTHFKAYSYFPYFYYSFLTEEQRFLILDHLFQGMRKNSTDVIQKKEGTIFLALKAWESRHFNMNCGMIEYLIPAMSEDYDQILSLALKTAQHKHIEHLSIRIEAENHALLQALEKQGFEQMDAILHFNGRVANIGSIEVEGVQDFHCREAAGRDEKALCDLARTAYRQDRFHMDPLIDNSAADEAYADWMKNSLNGLADNVFVVEHRTSGIAGFITINFDRTLADIAKVKLAKIWLVAIAGQFQGSGAAYALLNYTVEQLKRKQTDLVEVGTQLANVRAMRFYTKYGLLPVHPVYAYRKHIKYSH